MDELSHFSQRRGQGGTTRPLHTHHVFYRRHTRVVDRVLLLQLSPFASSSKSRIKRSEDGEVGGEEATGSGGEEEEGQVEARAGVGGGDGGGGGDPLAETMGM